MKRLLGYLVLVSTLGCAAALAGDPAAPMSPAAAQPVRPAPLRLEKGTQALLAAVQAAEESKPKKPSFFGRRLKGLAMLVAGAAPFGAGYFGYSNLFAQEGAQRLVSSGPYTSGEATRLALWKLQYAQTEQEIYGAALGLVQPLLQLDPEAARRAAEGIKDPFWKASALAQMGEARLGRGETELALGALSEALSVARSAPTVEKAAVAGRVLQIALGLQARDPRAAARLRAEAEPVVRGFQWESEDSWTSELQFWVKVQYGALLTASDTRQVKDLLRSNREEESRLRAASAIALWAVAESAHDGTADPRSWSELLAAVSTREELAVRTRDLAYELAGVERRQADAGKSASRQVFDALSHFRSVHELTTLADQITSLSADHPDLARELCLALARGDSYPPYEIRWNRSDGPAAFQTDKKPRLAREQDPCCAVAADEVFLALMLRRHPATKETMLRQHPVADETQEMGPLWEDYQADLSNLFAAWGDLVRALYQLDPATGEEVLGAVQHRGLLVSGTAAITGLLPREAQASRLDRLVEAMRPVHREFPQISRTPLLDPLGLKSRKARRKHEADCATYCLSSLEERGVALAREWAMRRLTVVDPATVPALLERDRNLFADLSPDAVSGLVLTDSGAAARVVQLIRTPRAAGLWDTVASWVGGFAGSVAPQGEEAQDLTKTRFARHAAHLPESEGEWALGYLESSYGSLVDGLRKAPGGGVQYPQFGSPAGAYMAATAPGGYLMGLLSTKAYRKIQAEAGAALRKECLQQLADDWAGALSYLASVNLAEAEAAASGLTDPYQACQSLRLAAQSAARTDPEGARRLLAQAGTRLQSVKDEKEQSQARADLAVATALLDADAGVALAAEIRDPAHRIWARALLAERLDASDADRATQLLGQAQLDLPLVKDPKRRAYVGCVLARAWLGADREQALAEADAPHLATVPW